MLSLLLVVVVVVVDLWISVAARYVCLAVGVLMAGVLDLGIRGTSCASTSITDKRSCIDLDFQAS